MTTIKDRLKLFETNGPPIKPKPKSLNKSSIADSVKSDNSTDNSSRNEEVSDQDDKRKRSIDNSEISENYLERKKSIEKTVYENPKKLEFASVLNNNLKNHFNPGYNVKLNQTNSDHNSPLKKNFPPRKESYQKSEVQISGHDKNSNIVDSSEEEYLGDFSYEFNGSIYYLPGLENFILNYDEEIVTKDVPQDDIDRKFRDTNLMEPNESESNKDDDGQDLSDHLKRNSSKRLIEEIFNTSVWRNSQNFCDDFIFNPVTDSQSGTDVSVSDKYADCSSVMSSSVSGDDRKKSAGGKPGKKTLFSGIFKSKRGPKKSNEKIPTNDQANEMCDSDGAQACLDKASLNKTTDGDTDSVDNPHKKPLNSIFNRDWLNSLGEGIKKKANVMAELRKVFGHGKPKNLKKKTPKKSSEPPFESTVDQKRTNCAEDDDVYDDGGEDMISSEEEEDDIPMQPIIYQTSQIQDFQKLNKNLIENVDSEKDDIYDEDDGADDIISSGKDSNHESVYDDGEEVEIPNSKSTKGKSEITMRSIGSVDPKRRENSASVSKGKAESRHVDESIYDSAGDDEDAEIEKEPSPLIKEKKFNFLHKNQDAKGNVTFYSSSRNTKFEGKQNTLESDETNTDGDEGDPNLTAAEVSNIKVVKTKDRSDISIKDQTNNNNAYDFKKRFLKISKNKTKDNSSEKANEKHKDKKQTKNMVKVKDPKAKFTFKKFLKTANKDDVYDVDDEHLEVYADDCEETVSEYNKTETDVNKNQSKFDTTYDSDDSNIEEYASDQDADLETCEIVADAKENIKKEEQVKINKTQNSKVNIKNCSSNKGVIINAKNKETLVDDYQDKVTKANPFKKIEKKGKDDWKKKVPDNGRQKKFFDRPDMELYDEDNIEEYASDADSIKNEETNQENEKTVKFRKQVYLSNKEMKAPKSKAFSNAGHISTEIKEKQSIIDIKFMTPTSKGLPLKGKPANLSPGFTDNYTYDEDDESPIVNDQEKSTPGVECSLPEIDDPVIKKLIKKNLQAAKKTFKLKDPIVPLSLGKAIKTVYSTQKNYLQLNIGELVEVIMLKNDCVLVKNGLGKCGWTAPSNLQILKTFSKL